LPTAVIVRLEYAKGCNFNEDKIFTVMIDNDNIGGERGTGVV
jgi:hypothetical protein